MEAVVCIVPVSPLRKDAAARSEMTSQLLFGEMAELLETGKDFMKIRCLHDDYEGWCQTSQLNPVDDPQVTWHKQLSAEWVSIIEFNGQPMHLSHGSSLDMLHKGNGQIGKYAFSYQGRTLDPS